MVPIEIADRASYLQMMYAFFPTQEVQPWMRQGIRIIIRDEPDTALIPNMTEVPRTVIYPIDIGPQAMTKAMQEDAEDESIPPDDRAQALLALAIQDYGYGRKEDALEKYNLLLGYFQQTKNVPMQAVVLNNIGDVYHLSKEYNKAQIWYETAVPPAVEGENPVIFHTVVKNLADVVYKQQNYPMAEQCYKDAGALATHLCNPEAKAQDLEGEGLSQEHQGELDKAIHSWESAAKLCRSIGEMEHFLRPNLEHLARAYQQKRDAPKLLAVKEELGTFGPAKDRCER
jgi:tetratricopeptide (TPR) repeat protein